MLSVSHHFFDIRLSQGTLRSSQCAMTHESRMIVIIHIISSLAITFSVVYLFMDILSIMRLFTSTLTTARFYGKIYEKLQSTWPLWNGNTGSCFTVVYSWGTKTQIGGFTPTLFIIFNGNRKGHVDLIWYSKTLNNACKTHNLKNNVMLRLCTFGNLENSININKKCCKNQCTSVNSTLSALLPQYYQVTTSWIHKYTLLVLQQSENNAKL